MRNPSPQRRGAPRRAATPPPLPLLLLLLVAVLLPNPAAACTRVLYQGENGTVITGRTLDWLQDTNPKLWAMPRGMARDGAAGPNSVKWSSKYGSIVVSMYDIATLEGLNEKGLVANGLYLVESDYGKPGSKPTLSIAAWVQYVLDNYASVSEAVEALRKEPFRIIAPKLPDGHPAQGHLALSDASGDSAIFEYVGGNLTIHHGRQYVVMTNSPTYDQQLAIDQYWKNIGGLSFLPGTNRAADRFARASFLVQALPRGIDESIISAIPNRSYNFQAMASVRSVMQSVSVPLGIRDPALPNIASTHWRTVTDSKNRVLLYDSATSPNAFWVVIDDLDLGNKAGVRKLDLSGGRTYSGNAASSFKPAEPFKFLPATPARRLN